MHPRQSGQMAEKIFGATGADEFDIEQVGPSSLVILHSLDSLTVLAKNGEKVSEARWICVNTGLDANAQSRPRWAINLRRRRNPVRRSTHAVHPSSCNEAAISVTPLHGAVWSLMRFRHNDRFAYWRGPIGKENRPYWGRQIGGTFGQFSPGVLALVGLPYQAFNSARTR